MRKDRQRFAFAVRLREPGEELLAFAVVAEERHGGLGERPLEMHVAHLGAARAELLAGRFLSALDHARIGRELLDAIEAGSTRDTPQDESLVTYAPKLAKSEGLIDWSMPSMRIHNLVRGLWPWPHAFTHLAGVRYIVHRSRVSHLSPGLAPAGTVVMASAIEGLHVACGAGAALELVDIQLEGKRVMSARDLMASKALIAGARFTTP